MHCSEGQKLQLQRALRDENPLYQGEPVFEEGDDDGDENKFYIIKEGNVDIVIKQIGKVRQYGKGDCFGER